MTAFIKHESDVLVCTTIIGSGMDIPNANTIIVDRADNFGLSELYQLRGRVGRYKHRAFAYLLIPGDKALSQEAQQRLKALEEFSTLGSGFRIAMRDLEIRGAGNLLGAQQSGNIASVGFETYNQLIAEAVAEQKGAPVVRRSLPPFDITAEAYLPDSYVEIEAQKITLYKRISSLLTVEEVDEMYEEMRDRFGDPPKPTRRLLEVMRARALAADAGVYKLFVSKGALTVQFESRTALDPERMHALAGRFDRRVEFASNERASFRLELATDDPVKETQDALSSLV
jgi:transcription-repair coupling factor (superfamily II helicase)